MISLLLATALLNQTGTTELSRAYKPGQHLTYEVKSGLLLETKPKGLETYVPSEIDFEYQFTLDVLRLKADGIAEVRYKRPTMTQIDGETFDSPPETTVEKVNLDARMLLSPINEILDIEDLSDPKSTAKSFSSMGSQGFDQFMGSFVGDVYRLALFIGPLDSSLDLSPKLPLESVAVGDTWRRTVSYQPQKLKGKGSKHAVQRLDYTYRYDGIVESNGKRVYRVTANLDLDTDLAEFANQAIGATASETGLKSVPIKLKSEVAYDLDLKTMNTILATASSEGSFDIYLTVFKAPMQKQRFKGKTTLRLISEK